MTSQTTTIRFDDVYSFLVLSVLDEDGEKFQPISYHINDHLTNELYTDTFNQIRETESLNVVLTIASAEIKMIEQILMFHDIDAMDKVQMDVVDKAMFETKYAWAFEE